MGCSVVGLGCSVVGLGCSVVGFGCSVVGFGSGFTVGFVGLTVGPKIGVGMPGAIGNPGAMSAGRTTSSPAPEGTDTSLSVPSTSQITTSPSSTPSVELGRATAGTDTHGTVAWGCAASRSDGLDAAAGWACGQATWKAAWPETGTSTGGMMTCRWSAADGCCSVANRPDSTIDPLHATDTAVAPSSHGTSTGMPGPSAWVTLPVTCWSAAVTVTVASEAVEAADSARCTWESVEVRRTFQRPAWSPGVTVTATDASSSAFVSVGVSPDRTCWTSRSAWAWSSADESWLHEGVRPMRVHAAACQAAAEAVRFSL